MQFLCSECNRPIDVEANTLGTTVYFKVAPCENCIMEICNFCSRIDPENCAGQTDED
jgi:hypothetical protein